MRCASYLQYISQLVGVVATCYSETHHFQRFTISENQQNKEVCPIDEYDVFIQDSEVKEQHELEWGGFSMSD